MGVVFTEIPNTIENAVWNNFHETPQPILLYCLVYIVATYMQHFFNATEKPTNVSCSDMFFGTPAQRQKVSDVGHGKQPGQGNDGFGPIE